jgi:hypothetical protein
MYSTNHGLDGYCLLYYVPDNRIYFHEYDLLTHQIIPYCLRSLEENIFLKTFDVTNESYFNFVDLRKRNISSQQLLSWSASIDLAEDYEMFLSGLFNSSMTINNDKLFYNCTTPWFGPYCCFAFELSIKTSFDDIVSYTFESKERASNDAKVPCYNHLNCNSSFVCLDWRDICDSKIDCIDGSDEINCWQLEMNECNDNEYRCHNGQCIPQEFLRDNPLNPDCLDNTDESIFRPTTFPCSQDPSFRCEEYACRPGSFEFPCGDGECTAEMAQTCGNGRGNIFFNDICSTAMACILKLRYQSSIYGEITSTWCERFCTEIQCGKNNCSSFYTFPSNPILFGHVHFVFLNHERTIDSFSVPVPDYICYNEQLCADFSPATKHFNGLACRLFDEFELKGPIYYHSLFHLVNIVKDLFRSCSTAFNQISYDNHSMTYRCLNSSKFISKHRLVDGIQDCPFNDDETFNDSCSLNDARHRYNCSINGRNKCFASLIVDDGKIHCEDESDERQTNDALIYLHDIQFSMICDGIDHLISINGQNETDETNCEYWECNNTYTRCDEFWSCRNGADEIGCSQSNCSEFEHSCVFPNDTSKVSCLPISQAGDGIINCLGATDERRQCQILELHTFEYGFECSNESKCISEYSLCDGIKSCRYGDDEAFCSTLERSLCYSHSILRTDVENFLCKFTGFKSRQHILYFVIHNMPTYPRQLIDNTTSVPSPIENKTKTLIRTDMIDITYVDLWRCNRGISIQVRMNNDDRLKLLCLCPPSYYGDECQFENQRVSLTVQIRATSDWRSIFILFITLIDNERNIQSYDHIEYLPIRDCDTKFNVYLLYSTRPKNTSKNYSVQIDAFDQLRFQYRTSWIFPLQFSFLPVHRLSILLTIPNNLIIESIQKCQSSCLHGQCVNYINNPNASFCRCFPNWSGTQCNIKYTCNCASDSLCISNSIYLCSLNHYGSRCHLIRSSCHSKYCFNSGRCVSNDERGRSVYLNEPMCICPIEYSGNRCEHQQSRIDVSFDKKLIIPSSLFIHLITIKTNANPIRTSTMKKISFDQNSVLFLTSTIFNIALVEFSKDYYLIILREQSISSIDISTQIVPSYRCLSIDELFNKTIVDQHLLKRIKLYHLPCRERLELICFYDSEYLCFCDNYRRVNCLKFDHNKTYDCRGYNLCENDGQCFEDDPKCPTLSICVCPPCYYGSRCQFSTKGSTLSLDIILGYRIQSNVKIHQQPSIVKFAIILTTIIFIVGWISNIFSYLTFRTKETRIVGCGFYLFALSITSLITISVLTIKFWLLVAAQIGSISNDLFLNIQCRSIDFILRVLVSAGDWFNACVAIERMINISRGVNFNKVKSRIISQWMIGIVYFFTLCTHIHDPIYRHLINDEEENRTWCVTKYTSYIQIYDWIVNIFHFSFPFSINCISGIIIIILATRTRSNVQKKQLYRTILQQQLSFHKHLLISPLILVSLAVPRLIISFLSGCMKSTRDSWFYLIGYFISFIPSMLTFFIFILPSKTYQKEFNQTIKRLFRC